MKVAEQKVHGMWESRDQFEDKIDQEKAAPGLNHWDSVSPLEIYKSYLPFVKIGESKEFIWKSIIKSDEYKTGVATPASFCLVWFLDYFSPTL
jgi:hypothetical protein